MVHNQLLVSLTPEQLADYERRFVVLRKQYGDLPILMRVVREDFDRLKERTGSRLGSGASSMVVIDVRHGRTTGTADQYYKEIENRLKTRLGMIAWYTQTDIADVDLHTVNLDELEEQVNRVLESTD